MGLDPLPAPFPSWESNRIRIRRNSVHVWAGPSAAFKTMILTNAIMNMKLPTLMFSTDSDENTLASRMLGIITGTITEQTEGWLNPNSSHLERASQLLSAYDYIRFNFEPSLSLEDVWNEVFAYATVEDCWPDQLVIDLGSDVYLDGSKDEWQALKQLMREAKVLARHTGAAVHLVLHVGDGWRPTANQPVPSKGDVLGKVSGIPVLMMNFAPGEDGEILAACVKNRFAKCDPSGRTFIRMSVNPETAKVSDHIPGIRHFAFRAPQGGEWWKEQE